MRAVVVAWIGCPREHDLLFLSIECIDGGGWAHRDRLKEGN